MTQFPLLSVYPTAPVPDPPDVESVIVFTPAGTEDVTRVKGD